MKRCQTCRWFVRDTAGTYIQIDGIRSAGTCRIRSTPDNFPHRHGSDWCGEHHPKPAETEPT